MYNAVPQLSVYTPPLMNECCDQSWDFSVLFEAAEALDGNSTYPGPMLQANCAMCVRWRPRRPLSRLMDVKTWNLSKCPSAQEPVEVHPSKPHIKSAALFEILVQKFCLYIVKELQQSGIVDLSSFPELQANRRLEDRPSQDFLELHWGSNITPDILCAMESQG